MWLVNARDVKHLPGRGKSDTADCVWHCKLNERGMLRRSRSASSDVRRFGSSCRSRRCSSPIRTTRAPYDRLYAEFPGLYKAQRKMFARLNRDG